MIESSKICKRFIVISDKNNYVRPFQIFTQQTNTCTKSAMETIKKVKSMFKANNKDMVTLMLSLNIFLYCFYWLWMGKYLLDSILPTDQTLNVAEQEKILRLLIKTTPTWISQMKNIFQ